MMPGLAIRLRMWCFNEYAGDTFLSKSQISISGGGKRKIKGLHAQERRLYLRRHPAGESCCIFMEAYKAAKNGSPISDGSVIFLLLASRALSLGREGGNGLVMNARSPDTHRYTGCGPRSNIFQTQLATRRGRIRALSLTFWCQDTRSALENSFFKISDRVLWRPLT